MRWQTTVVLAALLAALGIFYYVYEIRLGPAREAAEVRKGRLWGFQMTDVVGLTLRRADGDVVRLERDGDTWRMLEPVVTRGDQLAAEEVVATLATARVDREVAAEAPSLADFGLEPPAAEVTVALADGREVGLELGAKNPTGVWVYARERDRPAVVLLSEIVLRDVTRPASDFRDKTILAFNRLDVTGVDIVVGDDTLTVEQADGRWRLTRPVALPADGEAVTAFLDALGSGRVQAFVDDAPASLRPFGLDRPIRVAVHTGRDTERATRTLLLGRHDPQRRGVFAARPDEPNVLLLPEEVWTALPRNVAALRDKTVVAYERDRVSRLEIDGPRGAVTVVREGDRWRLIAPDPAPADPVQVGTLLSRLRGLRAQAFLAEDATGIARYLARPRVRVTLIEEGADEPLTLLLAPSGEQRGGRPSAYAAVAGRGPVVLVDAAALSELAPAPLELRDRTLVSGLEPRQVRRVRVRAGDRSVLVERRGEDAWRVLEPTPGAGRTARIEDLLYMLRGLRWSGVAAASPEDTARYGLDPPAMEIALYAEGADPVATILLGRPDPERAYVRTEAAPTVYTLDPARLGDLPKIPDDFQD